jgi:ankyrin repeat protein
MDVNQRLSSGNTILTSICSLECDGEEKQRKRLQLFEQSLDMGANINTKNRSGDTPLIIAAKSEDTNFIKSILTNGANTHDENKSSLRASQIGSASGSKIIADWLAKCKFRGILLLNNMDII